MTPREKFEERVYKSDLSDERFGEGYDDEVTQECWEFYKYGRKDERGLWMYGNEEIQNG